MTLFYYLTLLQNDIVVMSRCVQFTFGDKGVITYRIRESPSCDGKRGETRGEKQHRQTLTQIKLIQTEGAAQ